ncbi:hypothetical protein ABZP36_019703, partial [Zizania latifolia]
MAATVLTGGGISADVPILHSENLTSNVKSIYYSRDAYLGWRKRRIYLLRKLEAIDQSIESEDGALTPFE